MTLKEELLLRVTWEIASTCGGSYTTSSALPIVSAVQKILRRYPSLSTQEDVVVKILAEFFGTRPEDGQHIGERVRERRERLGIPQAVLAQRSEVTQQTISQIESGKLTNPTVDTLSGLSRALGVTLDELYYGS